MFSFCILTGYEDAILFHKHLMIAKKSIRIYIYIYVHTYIHTYSYKKQQGNIVSNVSLIKCKSESI